ncbi:MAG: hypothetical protein JO128_09370 [Alphaproteobacteria bacterium]|nr:hypothetical protein [Alphaproteobacteria bacterium]
MEYRTIREIKGVATVTRLPVARMSRRERLLRWAAVLDSQPTQPIKPLMRIEFLPRQERMLARRDESPLTIAYRDPMLREEGLAGDTLGEAVRFFELSDHEAHYLVCDCHYHGGMTMTPEGVAKRARSIADRVTLRDMWNRVRAWF